MMLPGLVVTVTLLLTVHCSQATTNDVSNNVAKDSSITKQLRYSAPYGFPYFPQRRRPIFPPRPPPFRRARARRPASSSASDDAAFVALLVALLRLIAPSTSTAPTTTTTMTTTTTTTTTAATTTSTTTVPSCSSAWSAWGECILNVNLQYRSRDCPTGTETEQQACTIDCVEWSDWSDCPGTYVDETRTRNRQCTTGYETENGYCRSCTSSGLTSDGWYRASNGYEYSFSDTEGTYTEQVAVCKSLDSSSDLATVGARSGILSTGLGAISIPAGEVFYVGGADELLEDTWYFRDGVVKTTAELDWGTISGSAQPNGNTGQNCLGWLHTGGSVTVAGFADLSCTSDRTAMCERKAACEV